MLADANRIVRKGLNSARRLVEQWQALALDGHRLKSGEVRWNDETIEDLTQWATVLFRLSKAERAFDGIAAELAAIEAELPFDRRTIQRGLRAALALAQEHRAAIINGFDDPETDPQKRYPECRRYVRPVDRTIAKIQAAMSVTARLPKTPGVSRELRDLMAATERARIAAYAAVDLLDETQVEAEQLCPAPEFLGRSGSSSFTRSNIETDARLSAEERAEVLAYADRLEATEASLGIPALDAASVTTGQDYNAAEAAVFAYRSRSLADCLAKLKFGQKVDYYGDQAGEVIKGIIADLKRLGTPGFQEE